MKKLLFILIFIPIISFGQENVLNIETIKDEYIKVIAGITYYNEKPYTGVFYRNYKNGQLRRKETYKSSKRNGLFEQYYETGELEYKGNYKDNELTGVYNGYYKNGQLERKATYKSGKRDGLFEQYSRNGQIKKILYKNGEIILNYRSVIGDTNIEDVNVYDLEAMVRLFLKDCELNNIKLSSDYKITSTFETLDKGEVALAYGILNDKEIIIKVSPEKWSKSSNPKKWYILYHELGHDVLNLQHGQGGKMMFNFTEKDYTWDDFFKDKDYMFNSMKSK